MRREYTVLCYQPQIAGRHLHKRAEAMQTIVPKALNDDLNQPFQSNSNRRVKR